MKRIYSKKWLFDAKDVSKHEQLLAKKWNLSQHEFNELLAYLTKWIFVVCNDCHYDYHIAGIASILFRRIYQQHSTMTSNENEKSTVSVSHCNDDPRLIAVICIFITAKSKDCNISNIDAFLTKIRTSHDRNFQYQQDAIVKAELFCLKLLSFDLNVFLPFEACTDLLSTCNRCDILRPVWSILLKTFKTNIYLLFPPYLIALACIYVVCMLNPTNLEFDIFLKKIHVPFENISEVAQVIVKQAFVSNKEKPNKTVNKDNSNNKITARHIPIDILHQIDSFYTKRI